MTYRAPVYNDLAFTSGQVVAADDNLSSCSTIANGQLPATATNDNASAGKVGEYVSSQVVFASGVSCTNNAIGNVTSISLTAGDWDVGANIVINNTGTNVTNGQGFISSVGPTSAPDTSLRALSPLGVTIQQFAMPVVTQRFSLSSTTTIYLNQFTQFGAGTTIACGILWARRVR